MTLPRHRLCCSKWRVSRHCPGHHGGQAGLGQWDGAPKSELLTKLPLTWGLAVIPGAFLMGRT